MSQLTSTESPATLRNRLLKLANFTSTELIKQNALSITSRDMAAFIVLSLTKISSLVDQTAKAWEDRNYWIKSDLFRKDWAWVSDCREELEHALAENNWQVIKGVASAVSCNSNLSSKSSRHSHGEPWLGSWKELQSRQIKRVH